MQNPINYDALKSLFHPLNTDDTIVSAHGLLCGFACVKPEVSLKDWLDEVLLGVETSHINEAALYEQLAQIYNETHTQLNDAALNFQLLIANDDYALKEQADTLIQWCQGFLLGLGLCKITTTDENVLEMIKDIGEISKLDSEVLDNNQNAQDLSEVVEFVRIGVLFIQEALQPLKQDYLSPETLH